MMADWTVGRVGWDVKVFEMGCDTGLTWPRWVMAGSVKVFLDRLWNRAHLAWVGNGWVRLGCLEMAGWLIWDGIEKEVGILLQLLFVHKFLNFHPPVGDFFFCIVFTKATPPVWV
jgi:hypothetical protein